MKSGKAGDRIQEDLKYYGTENAGEVSSLTTPTADPLKIEAQRWRLIVQNDIENLPIACMLALACAQQIKSSVATPSDIYPYVAAHIALFSLYLVFRVAHTICYALTLQPWRTVAFFLGIICELGMAINGLASLRAPIHPEM